MEFFRIRRDIPFMRHALTFNVISLVTFLLAVFFLATKGLNLGVDFRGGTIIEVTYGHAVDFGRLRAALDKLNLGEYSAQSFGRSDTALIRLPLKEGVSSAQLSERVLGELRLDDPSATQQRVEFVGPQVGRELQLQAVYLVLAGLVWIAIYLAFRFDLRGGVAAVVAVLHDVIVCLGALSLTNREFSLPVLAALLTIIGYSVNDTIVAYDRLRENRGKFVPKGRTFAQQMNDAVNQTLSRTILTSLTTFFSAAVLLFFGGRTLEDFAFVLFVGVITGTYSTTYVAAALVVDWTNYVEGRLRRGKKAVAKA